MAGNSLECYRATIGCFNLRCTSKCTPLNGNIILAWYISNLGLLYWLFLLIVIDNDVELNPGPNSINGFLLNARSIKSVNSNRNKLAIFQSLVSLKNASIVCLTETWLTDDIQNEEILPVGSHKIFRKDRGGYGGVLVAIHESIKCKNRPDLVSSSIDHNETVVVELRLPKLPKIALVAHYRPPGDNSSECIQNIKHVYKNIKEAKFNYICTMGNYNLPNLDTRSGLPQDNYNWK